MMMVAYMSNVRMSIDVSKELHKVIKICSAFHDESIRDYVVGAIVEKINRDKTPNAETVKAIKSFNNKKGVHSCKTVTELFKKLGI